MMKVQVSAILCALALAANAPAQTVDSVIVTNLFEPHSVVMDADSNIYVSDGANNRIMKYVNATGSLVSLAGQAGTSGALNGTGISARFFQPQGLVHSRGGLIVADSGNQLLRFVTLNGVASTLAGAAGETGFVDGDAAEARFRYPLGLAADAAGNIFIADSGNNAIRKLDTNNLVSTVATGFFQPAAVAVGENGELWVADTRRHVIRRIDPGGTVTIMAGTPNVSGSADSIVAFDALFTSPGGLLWLGPSVGLLISDSGNHTVRRLFFNSEVEDWSVQTFAGIAGASGAEDGSLFEAKFNWPLGLARDTLNGGFLVVDRANNAIRRIQTSPPRPPVQDPVIGVVEFDKDEFGERVSRLLPVTASVFFNEQIIAVLSEAGTESFFTFGPTPPSPLEDKIPSPGPGTGNSVPPYRNGLRPHEVPPSLVQPQPDMTIKVIGMQDGRRSSSVVSARFQFKTGSPTIEGDNAASFTLKNITLGAEMWYTIDGSDPEPGVSLGPLVDGDRVSLVITNETTFKARAYRPNFKSSDVATKVFSPSDYVANRITFGFDSGEASSDFVGSAGQRFYAPVTLSILPNQPMFSLQFNVTVSNHLANASVAPGRVGFESMLMEFLEELKIYRRIDPRMVESVFTIALTNDVGEVSFISLAEYRTLMFTNVIDGSNLLGVGWLARSGLAPEVPNLFDVSKQDLITYSMAKDRIFHKDNNRIVLGAYSFLVPLAATNGSTYTIAIGRPSATSDGYGAPNSDVSIEAVQTGSLTTGAMNATKRVTVGQRKYVVGDVYPFKWLNAGDFGDSYLMNADVAQVFQTIAYGLNAPVPGSDLEDAMNSCCGTFFTNAAGKLEWTGQNIADSDGLFDGFDLDINRIAFGDFTTRPDGELEAILDVRDVFVTFRRSLDPSLTWFTRYYESGNRVAEPHPNQFPGDGNSAVPQASQGEPLLSAQSADNPSLQIILGDYAAVPGETLTVPIEAGVSGASLRVLMMNLSVEPLDGSPPLTQQVQFTPDAALGNPTFTHSVAPHNFSGAWLDRSAADFSGEGALGFLHLTIPANATPFSAYRIHFDHFSASPDGFRSFQQEIQNGLVLLSGRDTSSFGDGIPDQWRLRHFGTLANLLSHADADADGDGASNWAEFKAGTNPNDASSVLRLARGGNEESGLRLRWPSVKEKFYRVECSTQLIGGDWIPLSPEIEGNGQELEFVDTAPGAGNRFYRVSLVEE